MAPVGRFPLFRLATLLARQLSVPTATKIKTLAMRNPRFRRAVCMRTGRVFHACELRFKMWTLALRQPRTLPPISDRAALDAGVKILGEAAVFALGGLILVLEMNRQGNKQENKVLEESSRWLALLVSLEELQRELALQQQDLDRLQTTLRRLAPNHYPHAPPTPGPALDQSLPSVTSPSTATTPPPTSECISPPTSEYTPPPTSECPPPPMSECPLPPTSECPPPPMSECPLPPTSECPSTSMSECPPLPMSECPPPPMSECPPLPMSECPPPPMSKCPPPPTSECPPPPMSECPPPPTSEFPPPPMSECPPPPTSECSPPPMSECPQPPMSDCISPPNSECPSPPMSEPMTVTYRPL